MIRPAPIPGRGCPGSHDRRRSCWRPMSSRGSSRGTDRRQRAPDLGPARTMLGPGAPASRAGKPPRPRRAGLACTRVGLTWLTHRSGGRHSPAGALEYRPDLGRCGPGDEGGVRRGVPGGNRPTAHQAAAVGGTAGGLLEPFSAALFAALEARRDDLVREGQLLPGAAEALEAVAKLDGVVQSVLTGSSKPSAMLKLRAFGLDGFVDFD